MFFLSSNIRIAIYVKLNKKCYTIIKYFLLVIFISRKCCMMLGDDRIVILWLKWCGGSGVGRVGHVLSYYVRTISRVIFYLLVNLLVDLLKDI